MSLERLAWFPETSPKCSFFNFWYNRQVTQSRVSYSNLRCWFPFRWPSFVSHLRTVLGCFLPSSNAKKKNLSSSSFLYWFTRFSRQQHDKQMTRLFLTTHIIRCSSFQTGSMKLSFLSQAVFHHQCSFAVCSVTIPMRTGCSEGAVSSGACCEVVTKTGQSFATS